MLSNEQFIVDLNLSLTVVVFVVVFEMKYGVAFLSHAFINNESKNEKFKSSSRSKNKKQANRLLVVRVHPVLVM